MNKVKIRVFGKNRIIINVLAVILACKYCDSVFANEPVLVDVGSCINIESHLERLTCYDKQAKAAQQAGAVKKDDVVSPAASATDMVTTPVEKAPVNKPAMQERTKTTEESFGLVVREDVEGGVELLSSISSLKERVPGRFQITLENGQVWYQKVGQRYRMNVGDEVRIYPSNWGSGFRLSVVGKSGFIQVERIR